jgi:hypothetical protein
VATGQAGKRARAADADSDPGTQATQAGPPGNPELRFQSNGTFSGATSSVGLNGTEMVGMDEADRFLDSAAQRRLGPARGPASRFSPCWTGNELFVVGNTGQMPDVWERCQSLEEAKSALQSRLSRVLDDSTRGRAERNQIADILWENLDRYDTAGVILNGQYDPNDAHVRDDGEPWATCTECNRAAPFHDGTMWGSLAATKFKDRMSWEQPRVRSALRCKACNEHSYVPLRCSQCAQVVAPHQMSNSQKRTNKRCVKCAQSSC